MFGAGQGLASVLVFSSEIGNGIVRTNLAWCDAERTEEQDESVLLKTLGS